MKPRLHASPLLLPLRIVALAALATVLGSSFASAQESISESAHSQIAALMAEKDGRNAAQRKMDSQLVYFAKQAVAKVAVAAVPGLAIDVPTDGENRVLVDVWCKVSQELHDFVVGSGGAIVSEVPGYGAIRALLPAAAVESVAARGDVRFIEPAAQAMTNIGSVTSEGDRTHRANTARTTLGVDGTGLKIGVLSDGVNSLANSKANGNLNATASALGGQAGSGDEGTAMMELIQDLLPGAQLVFATAFSGTASFASNIQSLQAAGCSVIVDDVTYFNESPFQDQIISQAVTTVSNAGVMYFSSARNSGNKNDGTAGTWEGDFSDGGAAGAPVTTVGNLHNFGSANFNTVASGGSSRRVDLFWADPLGGSTNDYDLFVLDSTGATVLRSSTNIQSGTQDPYESVSSLNVGERIVIVKKTGAAARFLHLDTGRAVLSTSTQGNVRGHNASVAANAFSVAATNVANSPSPNFFVGGATNPVETFSSDGPRRMFFNANGTAITPGNFSSTGGTVFNKPDITAADGAATSVTGFTSFFGTSAAAPHAAAVAGMIKSYKPSLTPAQIRTLMTSTALDIEAAGLDRDSGSGIVMALQSLQGTAAPDVLTVAETGLDASGPYAGPFTPSSGTYTLTNTSGSPVNWTAASTQGWNIVSPTSGTLGPGNSVVVTCSINNNAAAVLPVGSYIDTVTITNTGSGFSRQLSANLNVQSAAATINTVWDSFTNASTISFNSSTPHTIEGQAFSLSSASGTTNIGVTKGTAYMVSIAAASYTNIRLTVTFWGAASNLTSGATPAFSNNLGSYSFDLGPFTVAATSFYTIGFTLPSTVVMPAQTGGVSFKYTADSGSGLVANENLTPLLRYGTNAVAVGTPTAGTAGQFGWYQNVGGETDGNFLASSFRTFGQSNQAVVFQLQAVPSPTVPVIEIKGNGATVANGSVTPSATNDTDFGSTNVASGTVAHTFTIKNNGSSALNLTGTPKVALSGAHAADFTVTALPTSPVAASGTTTFQITFDPSASGLRSATATVINNDSTANPFTFAIQGTGSGTTVTSLSRANASPSNASTVNWTLNFASAVTGVTSSNFSLAGPAAAGASIGTPTTSDGGVHWNVPVTTGATDGTLTLNLANASGLSQAISTSLPFAGQSYLMDKTLPSLNLPAPITVTATSPAGAVVNYTFAPTDTGGSGIATSGASPASGSTFPIGTTPVNASATDNAGNTASGFFNVTVNPNPPPTGGTFTVVPSSNVRQGDSLTLTAAGWTDPDTPLTYQFFLGASSLNSPSGSNVLGILAPAAGSYTLKVRVTDAAGSFTETTQPLTVVAFTSAESWRQTYFGTYQNSGNAADSADPDFDGRINLEEFAFGTDPTSGASGPPALAYSGTFAAGSMGATGQPKTRFESTPTGVDFRALFNRRVDYVAAGLVYTVEFSANGTTWVASGATPTVLASNGTIQVVSVPYPAFIGGKKARFFKVTVTSTP